MRQQNSAYRSPEVCVIELILSEGILAASDIFKEYEGTGDFEETPVIPGLWD